MKLGTVLLGIVLIGGALAVTIWIGKYDGLSADQDETDDAPPPLALPEVSETGPHPKAVVDETEYDFGVIAVREKGAHTFTITNEGEAPLVLVQGETTCKCTLSKFAGQTTSKDKRITVTLEPGESTDVELEFEPKNVSENFRHHAEIWTNDPLYSKKSGNPLRLAVVGRVDRIVSISPTSQIELGELSGSKPITGEVYIHSPILDSFNIRQIESSHSALTAEAIPLPPEELETNDSKSGYRVEITVAPNTAVGPFNEQLTIHTDVRESALFTVPVGGVNSGPIRILHSVGVRWDSRKMGLNLGQFPASEGRSVSLPVLIDRFDGEFELTQVDADHSPLKVEFEPNPDLNNEEKVGFQMNIEWPAGSAPESRVGTNPVHLNLHTNHPKVPKMPLTVQYVAN